MPPRKVFVSYSHRQEDWVVDRLVPVLRAGGTEVLIDRKAFGVGRSVLGQMDETQDLAEVHLLVLSPEYLASPMCRHEMERAVALDPKFERGIVVPVLRGATPIPDSIRAPNPLYASLMDDGDVAQWNLILHGVGADLGTEAPAWLTARDEVRRLMERGQSVNLVVGGEAKWRPLVDDVRRGALSHLCLVDLDRPAAASRRGLIQEILAAMGSPMSVPSEPEDLVAFDRFLDARSRSLLALVHFDHAARRDSYGVDFFASLRYLVMEARKLTLLVQSRRPFATLLPSAHPLSEISIQTVELRGIR